MDVFMYFIVLTGKLALLFIAISFLVGLLEEYVPAEKIQKVLNGDRHPIVNNGIGAAFGALTPFCSCSTIPIVVGLLNAKVQFGAVMSFLIASPLLNPVIVSLLTALLGIRVTAIYVLIIFPAAVLTGYVWEKMGLKNELKEVTVQSSCCCEETVANLENVKYQKVVNAFWNAWGLFRQMASWLLLGAAIGAIIYGFVPEDLIIKLAGPNNPLSIPIAAVVGVPMYIRTETILPISSVLLDKGMGIGAVMALIIGGSGASIPEVSLLAAIFKRKLVITFVLTVFILAISSGVLFTILA